MAAYRALATEAWSADGGRNRPVRIDGGCGSYGGSAEFDAEH